MMPTGQSAPQVGDGPERCAQPAASAALAPTSAPTEAQHHALLRRAQLRDALWALVATVSLIGAGYLVATHEESIDSYLRGEIDLSGRTVFDPLPPDQAALRRIDFERLHARLIPEAVASLWDTGAGGRRRAQYAWRDLREEVSPDPTLSALWDELHLLMWVAPLREHRRIDYLLWAHNEYLDRAQVPYRIEASLHIRRREARYTTLGYRVLAESGSEPSALSTLDGPLPGASLIRAPHRVRVLGRVDRTDVVEGWLGFTAPDESGGLVLADRVMHFAVRHVWPALHGGLEERRPILERPFVPYVRAEARAALSPQHFAVLEETAEDQQALIDVAASIGARHHCGSRFEVFDLPYKGLTIRSLQLLSYAVSTSEGRPCPDVTLEEATMLVGASERLRTHPGLDDALEALAAWVSRGVATHELRHVMDGETASLECRGCDPRVTPLERAELSAYLASFAQPGVGYVAALQACAAPFRERERERDRSAHGRALDRAARAAIEGGCGGAVDAGLYARARATEIRLFGARPPAELARFPSALALFPDREGAVAER